MSNDWIKMRSVLLRDPRVRKMSSALKADKLRTLGALYAVWCLADEQTEDGKLEAYSYTAIDAEIGWSGFCKAMEDIGWIETDGNNVIFPRFNKHNGATAKKRARDAVRKKAARMSASDADIEAENSPPSSSLLSSSLVSDSKASKKPKALNGGDGHAVTLPDWWPMEAWERFVRHRKSKRATITPDAMDLIVRALTRAKEAGMDTAATLDLSVQNGWTGVFPDKMPDGRRALASVGLNERNTAAAAEAVRRAQESGEK